MTDYSLKWMNVQDDLYLLFDEYKKMNPSQLLAQEAHVWSLLKIPQLVLILVMMMLVVLESLNCKRISMILGFLDMSLLMECLNQLFLMFWNGGRNMSFDILDYLEWREMYW
ncbi:hypothetical protein LINPERHAP1_LOCUS30136, partial [Linum perenne]